MGCGRLEWLSWQKHDPHQPCYPYTSITHTLTHAYQQICSPVSSALLGEVTEQTQSRTGPAHSHTHVHTHSHTYTLTHTHTHTDAVDKPYAVFASCWEGFGKLLTKLLNRIHLVSPPHPETAPSLSPSSLTFSLLLSSLPLSPPHSR